MGKRKFIGPCNPTWKLEELQKVIGKKIVEVEFGEEAKHSQLHGREGIILHFDDNTSLHIGVGSNVVNLHSEKKLSKPSDVKTDLTVSVQEK